MLVLQLKNNEDKWDTMWHRTPQNGFKNNIEAYNALRLAYKKCIHIPHTDWRIHRL